MRNQLRRREGQRFTCTATVSDFGSKKAFKGRDPLRTILLVDVRDLATGSQVSDHLWFTCGKWTFGLQKGDCIQFDAKATEYVKGYLGYREEIARERPPELDFRLERPTKVKKLPNSQNLPPIQN